MKLALASGEARRCSRNFEALRGGLLPLLDQGRANGSSSRREVPGLLLDGPVTGPRARPAGRGR